MQEDFGFPCFRICIRFCFLALRMSVQMSLLLVSGMHCSSFGMFGSTCEDGVAKVLMLISFQCHEKIFVVILEVRSLHRDFTLLYSPYW